MAFRQRREMPAAIGNGISDLAVPADGQEAFFIELSGGISKNR
jgi:hypothetical protein